MLAFNRFDQARDPILLIDRSATILWANEAAKPLLTADAKNLLGLVSQDALQKIVKVQSFAIEPIEWIENPKSPVKMTALVLDISEADPSSNVLMVALKSTSQTLSAKADDTLSTMAHDIKNPLSAIFGYADALLDTASGKDLTPKHRGVLSKIRSTASRAIDLVRNLQHLSDLQTRGFMKARAACDLNMIVKAVVEGTWREDKDNPHLSLKLGAGELPVWLERSQLDRVVANLFSNALRYSPPSGKIEIETTRSGAHTILRIQNEGPHIPAEELPHIFERSRRGSNTGNAAGSGLGLYIVKQILDKAGAVIDVRSSEKTGTEFTLHLPAKA